MILFQLSLVIHRVAVHAVVHKKKIQKVSWTFSDEDFDFEENEDEMAKQLESLSSTISKNTSSSKPPTKSQTVKHTDIDVTVSINSLKITTLIIGNAYLLKEFIKGIETFKNM